VGRDGYVEVSVDADTGAISIGGACCIGLTGELCLADLPWPRRWSRPHAAPLPTAARTG